MSNEFYESVLPSSGVRVLAVFRNGLKKAPDHFYFDSTDDLLESAATYDGLGKNCYHACAAYKEPINRTGANVQAIKALWLDLDVGETKPYSTQAEAAKHFEDFRNALSLPKSHVVASGGGIHEYLPFSKSITPEQWDKLAALFAACLDHYGVKHDTSRTQDKASILRIPGTGNHKTSPARPVTLKRLGEAIPASDLWQRLKNYADSNGLLVETKPPKGKPLVTNKLIGNKDYPPSSGEVLAPHCAILKEVDDSGGDVPYEIWWRAMGVAKHCADVDDIAPHWTRYREATGHDKFDYQGVMDAWAYGPTTCEDFSKHSQHCASCVHAGKGKSPIHLGVSAIPVVVTQPPTAPVASTNVKGPRTFKAQWLMNKVAAQCHIGFSNGVMTRSAMQEDGTYRHIAFCDRYWQVMRRIRTTEGIWQLEIAYEQYPGKPPKTFLMDSSAVTARDQINTIFSSYELHIYGGKGAMEKTQELLRFYQNLEYEAEEETPTYGTMGWANEGNTLRGNITGEFVLGDEVFRPRQKPKKALLDETVTQGLREGFCTAGTTQGWVDLVDFIYNRPNAEAYQFVIASMFGAPLVRLMPGEGEWHGIPIVVNGETGAAKTSTSLVAMSIYTKGSVLRFNAEDKQGDTINALSIKMGSLRNLPCIMDEMTNATAEKISGVVYMTANGQSKDRMGTNGLMIPNPYRWDTLSIITSNDSLHEVLKNLQNRKTQEAGQYRSFQIMLNPEDMTTVFAGVNRATVEDDLLAKQYGCVGREWIQFLVNNRLRIQEELSKERVKYMINPNDRSSIRFYKDLLITIKIASMYAYAKGFIKWDVLKMMKWAEDQLVTLRDAVDLKDWDGTISDFIASLHGRTIVTRNMKIGPGKRSANKEMPMENLSTHLAPVARKATDDKRFVVTANALRDWAQHNRILPSTLIAEMASRGFLTGVAGKKVETHLINIGSGTTVTRPQAPCYEFDYDRVVDFSAADEAVDLTNVVQLPVQQVVTNSVTNSVSDSPGAAVSP